MIRRTVALFCVIIAMLSVTACSSEGLEFKGGSEKSAVVETALNAVFAADGDAYYSTFPPKVKEDYDALYVVEGTFAGCSSMDDYLKNTVMRVHNDNYGEGFSLKAEVVEEKKLSVAELDKISSDPNLDYYTMMRYVTEENTMEVYGVRLALSYDGDLGAEEKEVELYVINQEGKWYLHPHFVFFGY